MNNIPPYQQPNKGLSPWIWLVIGIPVVLIVCAVGGFFVMAMMLHPVRKAEKADSMVFATAKNVAIGVMMYAGDYDQTFPPFDSGPLVAGKLDRYLNDLMPPKFGNGDGVPIKTKAANYIWNADVSSIRYKDVSNTAEVWMFRTVEPDQFNQICVGYLDCHAALVDQGELPRILAVTPIVRSAK